MATKATLVMQEKRKQEEMARSRFDRVFQFIQNAVVKKQGIRGKRKFKGQWKSHIHNSFSSRGKSCHD
jgi:hypothetical protein